MPKLCKTRLVKPDPIEKVIIVIGIISISSVVGITAGSILYLLLKTFCV